MGKKLAKLDDWVLRRSTQGFSLKDRILFHVVRIPESCCWHWGGKLDKEGYGKTWDGFKERRAHKMSYEVFVGPVADGMDLHHKCEQRECVNPSHLSQVTRSAHAKMASTSAAAINAQKKACKCGREYSFAYGRRICFPCTSDYSKRYQMAQRRERKQQGMVANGQR